jgi:hypothetical protein
VPSTAFQEYRARLEARCAARDALTAADARFAHARLATFFSGVALALLAWRFPASVWLLLAPVAVFVWLVRAHARVPDKESAWPTQTVDLPEPEGDLVPTRGCQERQRSLALRLDQPRRGRPPRRPFARELAAFRRLV